MEVTINLASFAIVAILFGIVNSYPNSVPNSPDVCSKMIPGHGPRPQTTKAPYEIILNKKSMKGGHNLQIEIRGKNGETFRGFYIQVRDQDGGPIGTFLSPDENEASAHNCFNMKNNAIHHKNRNDKESITVYWKAPETLDGKVKVIATVVQDFETFWSNIQSSGFVSVSNFTEPSFTISSPFAEKGANETQEHSETNGVLDYNPYSPFPLLDSSWSANQIDNFSSSERLLSQPSEESTVGIQSRQLFGPSSFDFHGGLIPSKPGPHKLKGTSFPGHHPPPVPPIHENVGQSPLPPSSPPHSHFTPSKPHHPFSGFHRKPKQERFSDQKERHPFHSQHPVSYPPVDTHHSLHSPLFPSRPAVLFPNKIEEFHSHNHHYPPHRYPQMLHSILDGNDDNFVVSHHYPPETSQHAPPPIKPASDPSYPNSGYYPKDILTRLTSFIPNIYNSMMKSPLFNFNLDNALESMWKPSQGGPPNRPFPFSDSTSHSKIDMPRYGYLIYNPVRGNPYYVIPAANDEEFVKNHMQNPDSFGVK